MGGRDKSAAAAVPQIATSEKAARANLRMVRFAPASQQRAPAFNNG